MNWEQQFVESFITKLVNPLPVNMDALIDLVIQQIKNDLEMGDENAIAEMLKSVPVQNLQSFLSEAV
jgi:hypothetical protein